MKELSIEEKAKAYDEAIERAKSELNSPDKRLIEYIFPELKESEDERIRKALLEMVHDTTGDSLWVDYNVHKEDAIAWLEKQGGGYNNDWSEEDESRIITICTYLQDYARLSGSESRTIRINEYCDWLKSLKERYTWKPSDEQMVAINTAINVIGKGTINGKYLIELHEQLKKLRE